MAYPGIDDCLSPAPSDAEIAGVVSKYGVGAEYVLAVNLTNVRKNARKLCQAFAELLKTRCNPLALVFAGGWNLQECNLWRMASEAGIADHVHVTGYVTRQELFCLYHGARAFCMPSLYEGFGMPVAEAMACGIPVVASGNGAMAEVAGDCGILIDPEDIYSIRDGLSHALDNTEARERIMAVGKARATRFIWRQAAEVIAQRLKAALLQPAGISI